MTDYVNSINSTTLESDSFDGQFVDMGGVAVFENAKFTADQFKTYSLTDIIPFDGYDYEVTFSCFAFTGTTSGNSVECRLLSGTIDNNAYPTDRQWTTVCRAVTRASTTQNPAGSCTLVIRSYDRNVTFNNTDGSGTSGNVSLYVSRIRRLGTNLISSDTNYISKIGSPNNNVVLIGGKLLDGQWIKSDTTLATGVSLGASSVSGYSLTSILPNDDCTYELLCNSSGRTGTTANNNLTLRIGTSSSAASNSVVGRQATRTASYMMTGGQVKVLAKSTDTLYVANSGTSGTATNIDFGISAYRRVGTNDSKDLKNICVRATLTGNALTSYPNVVIFGNPTIYPVFGGSNVTDFSIGNYLDIPVTKYATATYIICFTTPSSTPSFIESIYHCEKYFSIELDSSFKITSYNNGMGGAVPLFTPSINTKYWVKVEINGTSKTFSYSTDGITYTTATTMIDTGMDITSDFKQRIGNNSLGVRADAAFSGIVHLDECSIIVSDEVVWQGMNTIRHLPVGGYIADGQWVTKSESVFSGVNLSSGNHRYMMADYLPENDVQYEILCYSRTNTGSSSGNAATLVVQSSDQVYGSPHISCVVTRTSSSVKDSRPAILVCTQKNGFIPVVVTQTSGSTTGSCSFGFVAYRRVGNNT